VATHDAAAGTAAVFLVNRSQTEEITVTIDIAALDGFTGVSAESLYDTDVYAKNTLEEPERVTMKPNTSATLDGGAVTVTLPPVSWTAVSLV
jgi:alpha-L-arabinofuranosidase